jgi:hypothetical protein
MIVLPIMVVAASLTAAASPAAAGTERARVSQDECNRRHDFTEFSGTTIH